jgi:hypothetical protein
LVALDINYVQHCVQVLLQCDKSDFFGCQVNDKGNYGKKLKAETDRKRERAFAIAVLFDNDKLSLNSKL